MKRLFFYWLYLFKRPPWDTGIPAPELVRAAGERPAGSALDLGCGTGTNVRYLAERGWRVTGVDFIPRAIDQARRHTRDHAARVTLLVGDVTRLEQLPLPGPFDLALDMGCYHSIDAAGRQRYGRGLKHWLRPGGLFMLYAFQPDPQRKLWGLTKEQVIAEFADGFRLVNYEQGSGRPSAWYYFEASG